MDDMRSVVAVCGAPGVNLVVNYAFQLGDQINDHQKTFDPGWNYATTQTGVTAQGAFMASSEGVNTIGLPSTLSNGSTTYVVEFSNSEARGGAPHTAHNWHCALVPVQLDLSL